MAAYAALVSLINNIEQITNHRRVSTLFDEKQLESLLQRVDSLLLFVESYNSYGGSKDEAEDLEMQITSAAHSAEDVIESHIVDQILPEHVIQSPVVDSTDAMIQSFIKRQRRVNSTEDINQSPVQLVMLDLRKIIEDMDSVREKVIKVEEERGCKVELPPQSSMPVAAASSRQLSTAGKSNMVGFDGYLAQLLDQLTGHQADRQIIPIVGMGGIGKSTLARNAYDSSLVVHHFDVCAWVTISEEYNVKEILFEILSCLGQSKDELENKTEHELGELLHRTLFGRRYLIVLDDIWSIKAWGGIKFFFPNNSSGSRILVTTRITDIANHFSSIELELNFLDDVQSWKLFCEKVFPHEDCPADLEESGKKIVKKCRGLPLAIVVISGVLRNSSRSKDQWENVAKDISSMLNTLEDNRCLKLLSLSYSHLPACLKPCFLYLGIFPEDDVIRVSRLVKLWVAEGFIKPNKDQSLEDTAEGYIQNLVDRNLISVESFRWNGKVKTFRIHDLLRDLCIRVAEREEFLCITSELDTPQEIDEQRRIVIHASVDVKESYPLVFSTLKSKSLARSLIFNHGRKRVHVKSRLLRVLVQVYSESRDLIFQQVNLRFLAQDDRGWSNDYMFSYPLPSSISLLWTVQTLTITEGVNGVAAPSEIWEMPQLRHLMFNFIYLPEPPPSDDVIVLHNLQTLGKVYNFRFSEEACKRMPNIKKLHVRFSSFSMDSANFASFNKLEPLHYQFNHETERQNLLQSPEFPNSLKKLTLESVLLQWKDLTVIGLLPHLEVLTLKSSMRGHNWNPVEGEFLRLRYLRIESCDLIFWNADKTHFPVLENLVLESLWYLNDIPSGVGDIQTLERISVSYCTESSALSGVKILEEQQNLGNEWLQVKVRVSSEWREKKLMEQVEAEGLQASIFNLMLIGGIRLQLCVKTIVF